MKRFKRLGVAVFATLCVAAVPASASASGGFVADSGSASLSSSVHNLVLEKGPSTLTECQANGNSNLERPSEFITLKSETLICWSGFESKLKMNGCEFRLHPGSSSFDIGPVGCGPMEATLSGNCPITIGAQTGLPASYENTGSGSSAAVKVTFKATKTKYTLTTTTATCGTKGTYENLSISSEWSEKAAGTGLYAYTGSLPDGIHLTESTESYLVAQIFPGVISGTLETSPATVFQAKSTSDVAKCTGAAFSGELATSIHAELPLSASYSGCNYGMLGSATVGMNSCRYTTGEFTISGGQYKGNAAIACSKAGDTITITTTGAGCVVTIPAQSLGGEAVGLKNVGQGVHATVNAHLVASNVQYTATGVLCPLIGFKKGAQADGFIDTNIGLSATVSDSVVIHG